MEKTDKIIELKKMLDEKVITQEEFEVMKQELLESNRNNEEVKNVPKKQSYLLKLIVIIALILSLILAANSFWNEEKENDIKSNENNSSIDIDFDNPSNIKNGRILINKYAKDLNYNITNIDDITVKYLETDNKGKYAFEINNISAVNFSNYSTLTRGTWYIILIINDDTYNYKGSDNYTQAKIESHWEETEIGFIRFIFGTQEKEDIVRSNLEKYGGLELINYNENNNRSEWKLTVTVDKRNIIIKILDDISGDYQYYNL